MKIPVFCKTAFLRALIASGLALGLGMDVAVAADTVAMLQAHSGCLCAADSVQSAKLKAKLMHHQIIKKSDIDVSPLQGVVTRDGLASSAQAKFVAKNLPK